MVAKAKKPKKTNKDVLSEQPKAWRESLTKEQKNIILCYASADKLRAVLRWPSRMAKARITAAQVAKKAEKNRTRISEYCNFHYEPKEQTYLEIESILYSMGA